MNIPGLRLASPERLPKLAVLGGPGILVVTEHLVMLALDFAEAVAHHAQKILVGADDGAVHFKLDHRL